MGAARGAGLRIAAVLGSSRGGGRPGRAVTRRLLRPRSWAAARLPPPPPPSPAMRVFVSSGRLPAAPTGLGARGRLPWGLRRAPARIHAGLDTMRVPGPCPGLGAGTPRATAGSCGSTSLRGRVARSGGGVGGERPGCRSRVLGPGRAAGHRGPGPPSTHGLDPAFPTRHPRRSTRRPKPRFLARLGRSPRPAPAPPPARPHAPPLLRPLPSPGPAPRPAPCPSGRRPERGGRAGAPRRRAQYPRRRRSGPPSMAPRCGPPGRRGGRAQRGLTGGWAGGRGTPVRPDL